MEEMSVDATPQFIPAEKRKINKRFVYLIIAVILVIILFVGYKISSSQSSNLSQQSSITPIPTSTEQTVTPTLSVTTEPTKEQTPTPKLTEAPTIAPTQNPVDASSGLDRSKLSVAIENGSGEAGVAKTASDFLTHLGYDVTATSNADNYDYTNVTIKIKSASSSYLSLLKQDLGTKYTVTDTLSDLSDSNSTDAIVIIGK